MNEEPIAKGIIARQRKEIEELKQEIKDRDEFISFYHGKDARREIIFLKQTINDFKSFHDTEHEKDFTRLQNKDSLIFDLKKKLENEEKKLSATEERHKAEISQIKDGICKGFVENDLCDGLKPLCKSCFVKEIFKRHTGDKNGKR